MSFGWWLSATPGSDHSHCSPHPSSYDWYEYTTSAKCSEGHCRVHAFNYNTSNTSAPYFEADYVLAALDLGNGRLGELGLSYFDKPGGAYAVGTRRTLDEDPADSQMVNDCHDAFHTLESIQRKYELSLPFDLENNCPPKVEYQSQVRENEGWQKTLRLPDRHSQVTRIG